MLGMPAGATYPAGQRVVRVGLGPSGPARTYASLSPVGQRIEAAFCEIG